MGRSLYVRLSGVATASSAVARVPGIRPGLAVALFLLAVLAPSAALPAQYQPPSEKLTLRALSAATWSEAGSDVIRLEGPVTIETDRARLSARQAVLWLTPIPNGQAGSQRAEIILLGDAEVQHDGAVRNGPRLAVTAEVAADGIQITADRREARDLSDSDLYREAAELRKATFGPASRPAARRPSDADTGRTDVSVTPAGPAPAAPGADVPKIEPVRATFGQADVGGYEVEGKVVVLLSGGVTLMQRRENGDFIELQADTAVLFTSLDSVKDAARRRKEFSDFSDAVTAAYLEGDVRITYTHANAREGEQRFRARRVYYEFGTDRAILTDAVVHTSEPVQQIPVVVRARTVRQLSTGEFEARGVQLSTSTFALPSYSVAADRIYVRRVPGDDPAAGNRVTFRADDATFRLFGVPFFWLPSAGGSMTDRGTALRGAQMENSRRFGWGVRTEWGLLETFGVTSPEDLDARYKLDFLSDRGPAAGFDMDYKGGLVTDTTKQRWSFEGDVESYFVYDHGFDTFGRLPTRVDADTELRGQAMWRHQAFLPYGWQAQLRAGYVSDPTFMEEYFRREFMHGEERDVSFYLKRQDQTEAFTFLFQFQPNNLVTIADLLQEQFEVERLPELAYHRIGDSVLEDRATLVSDNTLSVLRFNLTGASLREQGFPAGGDPGPGIPSLGFTGVTTDPVYRADLRQELDFPFSLGQFRVMPYVVGRYTGYSDSPGGGAENRVFGGAGARVSTSFWKVDNTVENRLLDLHRLRHVVEPEVNVFTSGTNRDRGTVFIYDEPIDAIQDLSAVQVALRQRWQTERGAPGKRRSVDFFSFNVEGNFFANEPDDSPAGHLDPQNFRGLYFASLPEASVARESVNADAAWRISDTTVVMADASYNLDQGEWATASAGLLVRRDEHVTYLLSQRYIQDLNSNIAGILILYELTRKYSILAQQSYDFGQSHNVTSGIEVRRRFDTFFVSVTATYDLIQEQSGVSFNLYPAWFGQGLNTGQLNDVFGAQRR
jgi:lipopolysaccharide assembly outer membrane protein LptD (OstA)